MLDRLEIRYPIIQAPMAGVSTPAMAAAVSNAGAVGSIGVGASSVPDARRLIEQTRGLTAHPFNVNVFCHDPEPRDPVREARWLAFLAPYFAEFGVACPGELRELYQSSKHDAAMLEMICEMRPAIVSFHFGLPSERWLDRLRAAGISTLATATCLEEARAIEAARVDAIVAQGVEAGGHRGNFDPNGLDECLGTAALLRRLVPRMRIPVIAAGGLMDGHDIREALGLGAAAAQLGTAFIPCPESSAAAGYRALLGTDRANYTRLTSVISGRPARGITNRFIVECEAPGSPHPPAYPYAYDAAKQLHAAAESRGSSEFGAHWAGQGARRARRCQRASWSECLQPRWSKGTGIEGSGALKAAVSTSRPLPTVPEVTQPSERDFIHLRPRFALDNPEMCVSIPSRFWQHYQAAIRKSATVTISVIGSKGEGSRPRRR